MRCTREHERRRSFGEGFGNHLMEARYNTKYPIVWPRLELGTFVVQITYITDWSNLIMGFLWMSANSIPLFLVNLDLWNVNKWWWWWGTRWHSWLRHCATSRKVAVSIPNGVIGIFHWLNPSGRNMAPESSPHLTKLSTRSISWGVKAAGA
jgi:hypothetical protein